MGRCLLLPKVGHTNAQQLAHAVLLIRHHGTAGTKVNGHHALLHIQCRVAGTQAHRIEFSRIQPPQLPQTLVGVGKV